MNKVLSIPLDANGEQLARLLSLQKLFAAACNTVTPVAQTNRCWNRVALHHLCYRQLREQFPQLGSQMACNVIYSVARTYRTLLNHPASPWNMAVRGSAPLPALRFADSAPVYFDRHTLSLKGNILSLFTLDGRLRFALAISADDAAAIGEGKLREIILRAIGDKFSLHFALAEASPLDSAAIDADLPEYVVVNESASLPQAVAA